jgi:hypothetical protein
LAFFPQLSHYSFSWVHNSSKSVTNEKKRSRKNKTLLLVASKKYSLPDFNIFVLSK